MAANQYEIQIAPDFKERYPGASPTATEAAMNLVRTADMLVKHIGDLVQPFGLSPSSALALGILVDAETPLPPNKIAQRLIISRATVTGYVRREPHPSDRRMLFIEPTESGCRVAQEFRLVVHRHQKEWLAALSETEQGQLIDALHRLESVLADGKD
jgi:DNA-binding MarR family transcriptional regulator